MLPAFLRTNFGGNLNFRGRTALQLIGGGGRGGGGRGGVAVDAVGGCGGSGWGGGGFKIQEIEGPSIFFEILDFLIF